MSRIRQFWLTVHRYAGLLCGLVLVVVSLSGSFLAFYQEIDAWLNPDWVMSQPTGELASMEAVLAAARSVYPDRFLHSLFPPGELDGVNHVWFTPLTSGAAGMWEVLVDPYTAQVLGAREAVPTMEFSRRVIANTIYTLHFQLFLGETGSTIVGVVGLALLSSGLTGIYLWWPRGRRWQRALTLKRTDNRTRRNYDLHRVCGIYSVVVLFVVGFSGVCMTFPEYVKPVVRLFSAVAELPPAAVCQSGGESGVDQMVAQARAAVPGARMSVLWMPEAPGDPYRVSLNEPGYVGAAGGRGEVWVCSRDSVVVETRRYEDSHAGEQFLRWQLPLHNGRAFGITGRLLVFVAGFVPLIMFITGLRIWLSKRRSDRIALSRASPQSASSRTAWPSP